MRYSHGIWYYQGRGYDTLLAALLEAEKNLPAGWRTRRERVSKAYRENKIIISFFGDMSRVYQENKEVQHENSKKY